MRILAIVAVTDSPVVLHCLSQLHELCDSICVQFDARTGSESLFNTLDRNRDSIFRGKLLKLIKVNEEWKKGYWHESLLKFAREFNPEIVFNPGHDETFHRPRMFHKDIGKLMSSDKKALMFGYGRMPTNDGREIPFRYPADPHMKVFKWEKDLTYLPYLSRSQIVQYADPDCQMLARCEVLHWCMYTREMEAEKTAWIKERYDFDYVIGRR